MIRLSLGRIGLVLWLALGLGAQEVPQAAKKVVCDTCKSHGHSDCPRHRRFLDLEHDVLVCSEAAACKKCQGSLVVDCKICTNPADELIHAQRRISVQNWLGERRKLLDPLTRSKGKDLLLAKSEHSQLTFSLPAMTVGKKRYDQHSLMHLYVQRIEQIRAHFLEVFELQDKDFYSAKPPMPAPLDIYLLGDKGDHRLITPKVTGITGHGLGVKLMGVDMIYSLYLDKRVLPNEVALHRTVAHNLGHLLLSNLKPTVWLGNMRHGWVDEGVGYYLEYQVDGRCTNICFEEVGFVPGETYKSGRWRVALRKIAQAGKLRSFTEIYKLNSDQLDWNARAHAFGYVEFLIDRYGGARFIAFVRRLMRGQATRDALKQVFDMPILSFDSRFKEWVREHYPLR